MNLVFGQRGNGCSFEEAVLEVVERQHGSRLTSGNTSPGVSRALEGWAAGPCAIDTLGILESLRMPKTKTDVSLSSEADPSHGLSFNVSLTPGQHAARSQVSLPYLHQGLGPRYILYDPDSADDMDDEDPDEDLDL